MLVDLRRPPRSVLGAAGSPGRNDGRALRLPLITPDGISRELWRTRRDAWESDGALARIPGPDPLLCSRIVATTPTESFAVAATAAGSKSLQRIMIPW